jgi:hypothetical protein
MMREVRLAGDVDGDQPPVEIRILPDEIAVGGDDAGDIDEQTDLETVRGRPRLRQGIRACVTPARAVPATPRGGMSLPG